MKIKTFLNKKSTYSENVKQAFIISELPVKCSIGHVTSSYLLPIKGKFHYTTENLHHTTENQHSQLREGIELTRLAMAASEKSLTKDWVNEDDAKWNSFIIEE